MKRISLLVAVLLLLAAWKLADLGQTVLAATQPIIAPWVTGSK